VLKFKNKFGTIRVRSADSLAVKDRTGKLQGFQQERKNVHDYILLQSSETYYWGKNKSS
jgi:hypothetical protein